MSNIQQGLFLAEVQARAAAVSDYEKRLMEWIDHKRANSTMTDELLEMQRFIVNAHADIQALLRIVKDGVQPVPRKTEIKLIESSSTHDVQAQAKEWLEANYNRITSTHIGNNPATKGIILSIVTEGDPRLFGDNVLDAIELKTMVDQHYAKLNKDVWVRRDADPAKVRNILDKFYPEETHGTP